MASSGSANFTSTETATNKPISAEATSIAETSSDAPAPAPAVPVPAPADPLTGAAGASTETPESFIDILQNNMVPILGTVGVLLCLVVTCFISKSKSEFKSKVLTLTYQNALLVSINSL